MIANFDEMDNGVGFEDDGEGGSVGGGNVEEEEHMEEDTPKEEASPNEACYFDVDPIEPNMLIPLNDS
jgi:hypothetical protein